MTKPIHYHLPSTLVITDNFVTWGYAIEEYGNEYRWVKWRHYTEKWQISVGHIKIEENISILSELYSFAEEKVFKVGEDILNYLKSLPKWDKTPYWIRLGPILTIRQCHDGFGISKEEHKKISSKIKKELDRPKWGGSSHYPLGTE